MEGVAVSVSVGVGMGIVRWDRGGPGRRGRAAMLFHYGMRALHTLCQLMLTVKIWPWFHQHPPFVCSRTPKIGYRPCRCRQGDIKACRGTISRGRLPGSWRCCKAAPARVVVECWCWEVGEMVAIVEHGRLESSRIAQGQTRLHPCPVRRTNKTKLLCSTMLTSHLSDLILRMGTRVYGPSKVTRETGNVTIRDQLLIPER